jgi:hypothetical protein
MIFLSCAFLTFMLMHVSSASAENMVTPDLWSYHVNAGKISQATEGLSIGETSLYLTLTTRYRYSSNDYANDSDIYQYLKTNFDEVRVGTGTISGKLYFRVAEDLDSDDNQDWSDSSYYFYRDALDKELQENDLAPRLYYGNLVFSDFLEGTKLVLGRQYVDNLNNFHIDGGAASYSYGEKLDVYIYGGMTVSYFYENDDDYLYGGGITAKPFENTSIQVEGNKLEVEDMGDDMLSAKISQQLPFGYAYVKYDQINDADLFEAAGNFRIEKTRTSLRLKYSGQYNKIDVSDSSYVVNPFTYSLMDSEKFSKYKININQQIINMLSLDLGGEFKQIDGDLNRYNREYNKYTVAVNIDELFQGNFIRISAEMMDFDDYYSTDEEKVRFGFQMSQRVSEKIDVWTGIDHQSFVYDYEDDEYKESVTVYYIGTEWRPLGFLSCSLDLSAEDTEMYEDLSDDLNTNYTAEAHLSLMF